MHPEHRRARQLTRRMAVLAGGELVLFAGLIGRLYYLQLVEGKRYAKLSDENRIGIRPLTPPRGRILDRFGTPLAANQASYRAVIVPEQADDISATLDAVAELVPIGDADRKRVLREAGRQRAFIPIAIRENLTWEEMARIEVNLPDLPGVSVDQTLQRFYPLSETVSHVVGYVAPVSEKDLGGADDRLLSLPDFRIGRSGIEKAYEHELRGQAGVSQVEVNAYGRVVRELARQEPIPGEDLVLSLDLSLQQIAAQRCAAEGSAAAVLLDAWSGEVLSLASSPGYDPNAFVTGMTPAKWKELTADPLHPLDDKAIGGSYAPGSTIKPIAALAALAAGAITPDTHFSCPGYFMLGNALFHCWKRSGHGSLAVRDAIKHSCDVFFYNVAHRLGIDLLSAMAQRFGFGAKLGIDLPGERAGLAPTTAWKLAATGVRWQQGDTISAGIGQGYFGATPLQLAIQAARLATGRAVVPRVARRQGIIQPGATMADMPQPDFAPLGLAQHDLKLVLDGMNAVVNEPGGTAYEARITEPGLSMGGKSGTSQVRQITQAERERGLRKADQIPWKERDHALFIAFAPVGAPRYVCAVVVQHGGRTGGGGSAVAAPICRDLLIAAQRHDPAHHSPNVVAQAAGR